LSICLYNLIFIINSLCCINLAHPTTNANNLRIFTTIRAQVARPSTGENSPQALSIRTEQDYVDWIKRFVLHFDKRHPRGLGAAEVEQFLTHLAVHREAISSSYMKRDTGAPFCRLHAMLNSFHKEGGNG